MFENIAAEWMRTNAEKALKWVCLHIWGIDRGGKILAALTDAGAIEEIVALGESVLARAK